MKEQHFFGDGMEVRRDREGYRPGLESLILVLSFLVALIFETAIGLAAVTDAKEANTAKSATEMKQTKG